MRLHALRFCGRCSFWFVGVMRIAQAAAVRGFRFSGFAGSDIVRACNGVYVLDKEGRQHNGHATYVSLLGHRFVYRNGDHRWVITSQRSEFGKNVGIVWCANRYVSSPVTAAGGWRNGDGVCVGVTANKSLAVYCVVQSTGPRLYLRGFCI